MKRRVKSADSMALVWAKFGQKPGLWLIDPIGKKLAGAP